MTVQLNAEQERMIQDQIASGRFHSVQEVLTSALSQLPYSDSPKHLSGNEAVRRIAEFAEKRAVKLPPGEKVSDLVHEGHPY